MGRNLRDESRKTWTTNGDSAPTLEQINMGSLLRIADASEAMAKNHVQLQRDRDMYFNWYEREYEKRLKLERQINALRGVITKMKKRV
ncbi:hypothetical protein, partial [Pandoraea apista]|uniref:hypothetical protein n=1 Tax=Pandoraea apista TaxID=93218 RepID=UPI002F92D7FB